MEIRSVWFSVREETGNNKIFMGNWHKICSIWECFLCFFDAMQLVVWHRI